MNKLKTLLICTSLLVSGAPIALADNQGESYEAIIMNSGIIMNTRQSTFAKVHSIKVMKLDAGVIRVVFNVELTKADGTFEYEQYEQELQPGSDWYNQSVIDSKLLDVRE